MRRPLMVHLTPKATAELFRRSAVKLEQTNFGARIFGWKKLTVIWETQHQPKRLLPIDKKLDLEDIFR